MKKFFIAILVVFGWAQFYLSPSFSYDEKAKDLYLTKCTKCHKLHDPMQYDDEQWQYWMNKMKKKSKLKKEQFEMISAYVDTVRKKSDSTGV